ncbi:MAG: hypothetical protein QE271_05290 [Bacteriovoracaceae bacterium]|nr:hypothetical protein [Bacteriovoracaceae bacterium]
MKQQWIKALFVLVLGMSFFSINVRAEDTPPAAESSADHGAVAPSEKIEDHKNEEHKDEAKKEEGHDKKKKGHGKKHRKHKKD